MKKHEFPNIPTTFTSGFPEGYRPWIESWSVNKEALFETLPDGTFKMHQMDISISDDEYVKEVNQGFEDAKELSEEDRRELSKRAEEKYKCPIGCEHCFECKTQTDNLLMTTDEVLKMLREANEIGVKSVKFLGPGEFVNNPRLFEILDFLSENEMKIAIFTKGVIFGDDEWSQKTFNMSAKELSEKIVSYTNVTILLGFTSSDRDTENGRIKPRNVKDYFGARNKACENLVDAGMNSDPEKQRLALICAPVLRDNIDEAFEIFIWGISRNIPVVVTSTMISGRGSERPEVYDEDFKNSELVKLYAKIYVWLIRQKIFTLAQIEEEGISPYPGYACNQFIDGMLVRKDGRVQACPGNESASFIYAPDVRKQSLKEVWKSSLGYRLREELVRTGRITLTQPCYAKSEEIETPDGVLVKKGCGSIPEGFYERVMEEVRSSLKSIV